MVVTFSSLSNPYSNNTLPEQVRHRETPKKQYYAQYIIWLHPLSYAGLINKPVFWLRKYKAGWQDYLHACTVDAQGNRPTAQTRVVWLTTRYCTPIEEIQFR